jgi:acetyl-CoA/propionyl-CoA/long-chain acyl-CoA carboxylase, biotin carboxylase, biotin carboxyl carrier protein
MFRKILIANRGEIAVRVARTCRELGVGVVAVYSDVDAGARHVSLADEAIHLPGVVPAETYLNVQAIIEAALGAGAEAIHPGYGFLSERADVAEAVTEAGLVWIGPPPEASRAAGDKIRARRLAESVGVAPVPGTLDPVADPRDVLAFGERYGYPVAIKAAGGGGGRGLKVAADQGEVEAALESARREAEAYFGYGDVYLERYLPRPKHVEVQVLAPSPGQAAWLGARDCSLQRRHQKLVEETPPARFAEVIPAMGAAATSVADACGYVNAGTVEFLLDEDGSFYFLEINARLQVEHTITEEVLGVDLVAEQLRIAAGEPLGFSGKPEPRGHAMECRINAEDPARGFRPSPGVITRYREPGGPGIRVDSGFGEGDEIPGAYDSLIAKLIVWGPTREEARRRMLRALDEYVIEGIRTTIPAHRVLLELPEFVDGSYTTRTVEGGALDLLIPTTVTPATDTTDGGHVSASVLLVHGTQARLWNPAIAGAVSAAATRREAAGGQGAVVAPMHGTVLKVLVAKGDSVSAGDPVAVLEAMKMETHVAATAAGTIEAVKVQAGDVVESGEVVAVIG